MHVLLLSTWPDPSEFCADDSNSERLRLVRSSRRNPATLHLHSPFQDLGVSEATIGIPKVETTSLCLGGLFPKLRSRRSRATLLNLCSPETCTYSIRECKEHLG